MALYELELTMKQLATRGKGILAADESHSTIGKRFSIINLESTSETRRIYREILFSTPSLEKFINGVILFEETLNQSDSNGKLFTELLAEKGIVPGIKVDKGLVSLPQSEEKITQGLDGLSDRLTTYKNMGAQFAKWRAVFNIKSSSNLKQESLTQLAIRANAEALAHYAAKCQEQGIVPIVEPEILMDGTHNIHHCAEVTEKILHHVFKALYCYGVILELIILKPSMVISGNQSQLEDIPLEVAQQTLKVLRRIVPAAVPTINFLSGGQTPEKSTLHLNLMNQQGIQPWLLSFSYGRALQDPCLKTWQGKLENREAAQHALYKRAQFNSLASQGEYNETLEQ